MCKCFNSARGSAAALLSLVLLAAGCDLGGSSAPPAEQSATDSVEAAAQPAVVDSTAPQRAVISERLPYAEVGDELVYGHFVFPADMIEPLPAVIVIHEWYGLNDNVHSLAERLAAEGYIVLAVDLFNGEVATSVSGARQHMLKVYENPEPAYENIRQAYAFVNDVAGAPTIGSLGWGFGGGWSLNTALMFPNDLDAAVIYYGQVTDDEEQLLPLNVPILGLFGAKDAGVPVASVEAFETALERLRKSYDIKVYPAAGDDFAVPNDNDKVASDAWQKTLEFFAQNLAEADDST